VRTTNSGLDAESAAWVEGVARSATELDWAGAGASAPASDDPHQAKLVEVGRRGAGAGDPAFTVAANLVTS
jgi:hypothetical protein